MSDGWSRRPGTGRSIKIDGGDKQLTEDNVQETFVALLRHHRRVTTRQMHVGWLVTTARHRPIDQDRRWRQAVDGGQCPGDLRCAVAPPPTGDDASNACRMAGHDGPAPADRSRSTVATSS